MSETVNQGNNTGNQNDPNAQGNQGEQPGKTFTQLRGFRIHRFNRCVCVAKLFDRGCKKVLDFCRVPRSLRYRSSMYLD